MSSDSPRMKDLAAMPVKLDQRFSYSPGIVKVDIITKHFRLTGQYSEGNTGVYGVEVPDDQVMKLLELILKFEGTLDEPKS